MTTTPAQMPLAAVQAEPALTQPAQARAGHDRLLLWVFTATIFVNAGLLFLVQPMFSRMVLPLFGGSAAVWTTCMLFFQTALLAGYFYAHVAPRWLGWQRHAITHLVLLAVSLVTLPIAVRAGDAALATRQPVPSLLLLLTLSLGAPFFLLSSGSPLLQRWFSHTGHASAANPYFLYAASNLGSMLALISYPLLLEPRLRLAEQSAVWTAGYVALIILVALCLGALRWATASRPELRVIATAPAASTVTPRQRMKWVALAFVPSSLLLAVTIFLTTDIAPVPLLWVLPLALYLLTFVIAFARKPLVGQRMLLRVQPFLLLPLVINMAAGMSAWPAVFLPVHVGAFVVAALICHGELARTRPAVEHLTEFYLWISVGGVLGGVFNVMIAPQLFNTLAEYPLALVLAVLLRPNESAVSTSRARKLDFGLPALLGCFMFAALSFYPESYRGIAVVVTGCVAAVLVFSFNRRPIRFGLGIAALLLAGALNLRGTDVLLAERSFFGAYKVERDPAGYVLLSHGSTIHGAQSLQPQQSLTPLTYYHPLGPLGQVFSALPTPRVGRTVAVVGLGAGSMTCYGRPHEVWTYYEIDPLVERIARDRRYFTFLSGCPVAAAVVIGDARLELARAGAHSYDLIIVDAFSSDVIPVHLVTREALALYLDKLAPGGVLAFNISNRYLDLQPVFARLASDAGLVGRFRAHSPSAERQRQQQLSSVWLMLARDPADLGEIARDERWRPLIESKRVGLWTDDFSNILSILIWR